MSGPTFQASLKAYSGPSELDVFIQVTFVGWIHSSHSNYKSAIKKLTCCKWFGREWSCRLQAWGEEGKGFFLAHMPSFCPICPVSVIHDQLLNLTLSSLLACLLSYWIDWAQNKRQKWKQFFYSSSLICRNFSRQTIYPRFEVTYQLVSGLEADGVVRMILCLFVIIIVLIEISCLVVDHHYNA